MTAAKVAEGCMRMNPLNENPALVQEFVQKIQGVLKKLKQVVHEVGIYHVLRESLEVSLLPRAFL